MLTSRYGFGYGMGYSSYKEAVALADQGNLITVVHCYSSPEIGQFCDSRIKTIYLPIMKTPIIGFLVYYFKLVQFLKKNANLDNFDLVYLQSLEFGLLNLKKIKIPIFYFARSTMIGLRKVLRNEGEKILPLARIIHFILVCLERRCLRYSRLIFVKSSKMIQEVAGLYNINLNKLVIISGGVDAKDFQIPSESVCLEFKHKLMIPSGEFVVLYAGRIVPQKGLIYLIEASLDLLKEANFVIIIAGIASDKKYLLKIKQLINRSVYKNNFYFLGHINQLDMSPVFGLADCLVTPSLYEPFGMVNLQAAFLNKDLITTETTGSVDLLANYPKIKIVKTASEVEIKTALKEILSSKEHGTQSSLDVSIYSWRNVAEQLSQYFSASK